MGIIRSLQGDTHGDAMSSASSSPETVVFRSTRLSKIESQRSMVDPNISRTVIQKIHVDKNRCMIYHDDHSESSTAFTVGSVSRYSVSSGLDYDSSGEMCGDSTAAGTPNSPRSTASGKRFSRRKSCRSSGSIGVQRYSSFEHLRPQIRASRRLSEDRHSDHSVTILMAGDSTHSRISQLTSLTDGPFSSVGTSTSSTVRRRGSGSVSRSTSTRSGSRSPRRTVSNASSLTSARGKRLSRPATGQSTASNVTSRQRGRRGKSVSRSDSHSTTASTISTASALLYAVSQPKRSRAKSTACVRRSTSRLREGRDKNQSKPSFPSHQTEIEVPALPTKMYGRAISPDHERKWLAGVFQPEHDALCQFIPSDGSVLKSRSSA